MTVYDIEGKEIKVGDKLSVAMSHGNGSTLRIGYVLGVIYSKNEFTKPHKLWIRWTHGISLPDSKESEVELDWYQQNQGKSYKFAKME